MALGNLIDGPSAAIVLGGTMLSTLMRAGWGDVVMTLRALSHLARPRFSASNAKGALAAQVLEIRRDGLLRAQSRHSGDADIDEATDALLERRSIDALLESHAAHKARRVAAAQVAVRTLGQAAELAPAFGLVGTLISLSQLPSGGLAAGQLTGAIAMAVLTTLYGQLTANLIYAPLARMIERNAEREERDRQLVIDWLLAQVAPALETPQPRRAAVRRAGAA